MYEYDMPYELRYDEAGIHSHNLLRSAKATASDGAHNHIWYVDQKIDLPGGPIHARSIISSFRDGAHTHTLEATRTGTKGSAHRHGVTLDYRRMVALVTETDGEHTHELLVKSTVHDGGHSHALTVGGVRLVSMMPSDLLELLEAAKTIERDVAGAIVNFGPSVLVDGGQVCKHDSTADAERCVAARRLFEGVGFVAKMHEENFHGLHWIARDAADLAQTKKPALPGRMLSAMERLVNEK